MARSKTPTKKAGAKRTSSMLDDQNVTALISLLVLVAYVYVVDSGFGVDSWAEAFGKNALGRNDIQGFSFLLVLHVLNHAQDAGTGFWIGSFVNVFTSAFAGSLFLDVVSGNAPVTQCNEKNLTLAFVCWYLTNHNVPFTQMNLWTALNDIAGDIIQGILRACSAAYTLNLIVDAVSKGESAGVLTEFAVFTPAMYAIFAGAAGQFFPLNKGLNINKCTDAVNYAVIVAVIITTNGGRALPLVGPILGNVVTPVVDTLGGLENAILIGTILNDIFGYFIPAGMAPSTRIQDFLYGVTGLNRG